MIESVVFSSAHAHSCFLFLYFRILACGLIWAIREKHEIL